LLAVLANHEPFHLNSITFVIVVVHAIIPNQGVGQKKNLTGVTRIRQSFLVTGHARAEDDLPGYFRFGAKTLSLYGRSVFKDNLRVKRMLFDGGSNLPLVQTFPADWYLALN
jgi:hypothetical protein